MKEVHGIKANSVFEMNTKESMQKQHPICMYIAHI